MGACCRTLQATQDYDAQPDTKAVACYAHSKSARFGPEDDS